MANKGGSVYTELFSSLPIPERLEPQNIAAFLEAKKAEMLSAEKTSEEIKAPKITVSRGGASKKTVVFRTVAAVAACAALGLGVAGYTGLFDSDIPTEEQVGGGTYAENYDDIHKTFEKYYVDDTDKKTLDSAIQDIEHSYNDNENPNQPAQPAQPVQPMQPDDPGAAVTTEPVEQTSPDDLPLPPPENPAEPAAPDQPDVDSIDDLVPLPENKAEYGEADVLFGDGFVVRKDANVLRLFKNTDGRLEYTDNIFPLADSNTKKLLAGFYADGDKLTAVYSVTSESALPGLDGLLDGLYGGESSSKTSVEVCVYQITDGYALKLYDVVQSGSLVDMNYGIGALYLVTAYNDYRTAPIIGVGDLESYVPSFTINGEKRYMEASDIMIPDYISTTDYTVISGISTDGGFSAKAVLGYEGRVILKNGAVYLFGYDNSAGTDLTSVKVFSLVGGQVVYSGYKDIEGVALGGDGISSFGSAIAVATVVESENGYITSLGIYNGTMESVAQLSCPGALTSAEKIGDTLWLSSSKGRYGIDLTDPAHPAEIETEPAKDPAEGLVPFDGGYVTLTKSKAGELTLSKISKNEAGELRLDFKTVVYTDGTVTSKALENNAVLFVSGNYVGVPYGYFDGFDYCYRYALYHTGASGFELVGTIENHEADEVFENGEAVLNGGVLYVFSEGRAMSVSIGGALKVISSADIVQSSYGGH